MNNHQVILKLRRLNTLLVLSHRSNNLALAVRRAIEEIENWSPTAPFSAAFENQAPRIRFAGYGPKFIKLVNELLTTENIALIDQLQPNFSPFFCELCELPGIGETGARRIFFDKLIENMDDLRVAATNGILQTIPAFGDARIRVIETWIELKNHDESLAACDVTVCAPSSSPSLPSEATGSAAFPTVLPEPSLPDELLAALNDVNAPNSDNALDAALKRDLARVTIVPPPSTSSPEALALSVGAPTWADDYALTRLLPPAFIARFLMAAKLGACSPDTRVLMYGVACLPLLDCVTRLVAHEALTVFDTAEQCLPAQTMLTTCHAVHCDAPNALASYDVILVDPIRFGALTPAERDQLRQHLVPGGRLVCATVTPNTPLPSPIDLVLQRRHLTDPYFLANECHRTESVDYMTILILDQPHD